MKRIRLNDTGMIVSIPDEEAQIIVDRENRGHYVSKSEWKEWKRKEEQPDA